MYRRGKGEGMNTKTNWLTKVLVVSGTILTALPVLAPLVFGFLALVFTGAFRLDYLMPAEMSMFAIAGGLMLLWAAIRMGTHRWFIGGSLIAAVVMLFGSQAVAEISGLASGEAEPEGLLLGVVMGGLAVYTLAVASLAVWGWRLWRQVFGNDIKDI